MSYRLGIDVGSTRTSATIVRDGTLRAFAIDGHSAAVSSASLAPATLREWGGPLTPHAIAEAVAEVVERACQSEGEAEAIAATYPATWNSRNVADLREAMYERGLGRVGLLSAPRAVAAGAAEQGRIRPGDLCAVLDVGVRGTTVTVLRVAENFRFAQLAVVVTSALSGRGVDEAVYGHLLDCLHVVAGETVAELLDPTHPEFAATVHSLSSACSAAKETLAEEDAAGIEVDLPGLRTRVQITRDQLARALDKPMGVARAAFDEALRAADTTLDELSAVLIVGGTTRLPLFATAVCEHVGPQSAAVRDLDPMLATAAGATLALCRLAPVPQPAPAVPAETRSTRLMARLTAAGGHRPPGTRARVSPAR